MKYTIEGLRDQYRIYGADHFQFQFFWKLAKFSQNPALWEGENLHGFILMEARDILRDGDAVRLDAVFSANFDGKEKKHNE